MEEAISLEKQTLLSSELEVMEGYQTILRRKYCAPKSLVQKSDRLFLVSNQTACLSDHIAFATIPFFYTTADSSPNGDSVIRLPGVVWAEIRYQSPSNHLCNLTALDIFYLEENCLKTFLFVGDAISVADSLRLTSYQPWLTFPCGGHIPDLFEKIFVWTFHTSVVPALPNSLAEYFLDGELVPGRGD